MHFYLLLNLFDQLFSALGSLLIVMGLYAVLWGKNKEMRLRIAFKNSESRKVDDDGMVEKEDLEVQLNAKSNANYRVATIDQEKQQEK
jgi:hypothetical protein